MAGDARRRRAADEVPTERALALVAHEQDGRGRVVEQMLRMPTDRPPVSIPFEAMITSGRGACSIFSDSWTFWTMCCPGKSSGASWAARSAAVSSSYASG